jgi:hypothetical protein
MFVPPTGRPVLAIIDTCHSRKIDSQSGIDRRPVYFLTSSSDICWCSAYVISEDLQLGLPTIAEKARKKRRDIPDLLMRARMLRRFLAPTIWRLTSWLLD